MISLLTSPTGPRSEAFSRRFSSARPLLGDGEQLARDRHRQLLDLQELDRGAEEIEGRADEAGAQMAHLAGELAIALGALGQQAEGGEAHRLAGDQAVVPIHRRNLEAGPAQVQDAKAELAALLRRRP